MSWSNIELLAGADYTVVGPQAGNVYRSELLLLASAEGDVPKVCNTDEKRERENEKVQTPFFTSEGAVCRIGVYTQTEPGKEDMDLYRL